MKKKISIISICYNEEESIKNCYNEIKKFFFESIFDYEHIFVDNFSKDNSRKIIREICSKDKKVKAIFNGKNYGPFLSNFNGLKYASGDYIIVNFPVDMQDPVDVIEKFLRKTDQNFDVIYAVKDSSDENIVMKILRIFFYFLISIFSSSKIPRNANEFLCISKKILDLIKEHHDYFPYIRGYFPKLTDNISYINYRRNKRKLGKSKNNLFDLYVQASNGYVSTIDRPIRILSMFAIFLILISFFFIIYTTVIKFISPELAPKGITLITTILLFFFSFTLLILSIILEYLIAIHEQVRFKLCINIDEKINFD
jgi:glycosyltransferase involved in cell wall biosynthesis